MEMNLIFFFWATHPTLALQYDTEILERSKLQFDFQRKQTEVLHWNFTLLVSCSSPLSTANLYFSRTTLCAGDKAQPHSEPDHAASVVLRLRQGGFPGAQTGSSFTARQQQSPALATERWPGESQLLWHSFYI